LLRLHHFQTQALRASLYDNVPFVLLLAGVQSGKTTAGAAWELIQWQRNPTKDHLILAPTHKVLQHSTLRKLDSLIPKGWATFNQSQSVYNLRWGGKVFVRSTEDPDAMEGMSPHSIWADEAGKYSSKAWENIQARRSATRGPVLLTSTPYGMGWMYHDFYQKWLKGLPEYRVVHFRSIDSPFFPKEEWDRAKRDMPDKVFRRKFSGIFTPLEGLIYDGFDADAMELDLASVPAGWQRIGGIDHGHSEGHPAAIGIWASPNFDNPTAEVWKVGEFKGHGLLLSELWGKAVKLMEFTGPVKIWYADPSAAQENAELKRIAGASISRLNGAINAVDYGIERIQGLMKTGRYRLAKGRCNGTKDELSVFARDDKGRVIKENDHLMDADRYALVTHMKPRSRITVH